MVTIFIPGAPVAKARARLARQKGFVRAYTPAKTARYEEVVRSYALAAFAGQGPILGPVGMLVAVYLTVPSSWSRKNREAALAGDIMPVVRPDIDNYVKAVLDGMNGVAFLDDAQVVTLRTAKFYAKEPGVLVSLKEETPDRRGFGGFGV